MSRCSRSHAAGFTLIELLIVMVIMSTTLALIIPFTAEQVDKQQQQVERQKIILFLQRARQLAFFKSEDVTLTFAGKQIEAKTADTQVSFALEYVSFTEEKQLVFSPGYQRAEIELAAVINYNRWTLQLANEETRWLNVN
ncbi:pilus assembly FimT family protein [Rheinheimera baltica]|uniref:pilus assembly FimT family protein n=1 Tax=Rheinheimera baltica TaxID=67576 RepID=UPI0004004B3D|nr:type II secretion system protein [Rheinheimera baltica]MDP5143111.1 type II secretion system protein [Rheinheimera baltica]MDP5190712.1 type II secretion system protein [Rheinheimera baltica]